VFILAHLSRSGACSFLLIWVGWVQLFLIYHICVTPVLPLSIADTDAYILSGNKQAFRHLWMKPSQKWKASFGGIDVQLHKYHVLPPKQSQWEATLILHWPCVQHTSNSVFHSHVLSFLTKSFFFAVQKCMLFDSVGASICAPSSSDMQVSQLQIKRSIVNENSACQAQKARE